MLGVIFAVALLSSVTMGTALPLPTITVTTEGLQFSLPDAGYKLVAYHFSVNADLPDTKAGQYNVDVTSPTGGAFVYTEPDVNLQSGDVVNYWVYAITSSGEGKQRLNLSFTYNGSPTASTTQPPATVSTSAPTGTPAPTDAPTSAPVTPSAPKIKRGPGIQDGYVDDSGCESFPCLIFEDNFDFLDHRVWEHEKTAGGGGNWEFQYYTNNRSNSYTRDGVLYIKPTLTNDKYGGDFITSGSLDLWGGSPGDLCTGNAWYGCQRSGSSSGVINPIQSARMRTSRGFNFRYGKVEVEAQLPLGDWLWPAIWMMPRLMAYGAWPASGEIDIMESRGNRNYKTSSGKSVGADMMGSTLHFGTDWSTNRFYKAHASKSLASGTFGDAFHKFAVEWTDNFIAFTVDGEEILRVDPGSGGFWDFGGFNPRQDNPWRGASKMAPFDQEFYIILNVAVGGTAYFGDYYINSPHPKPWGSRVGGHAATTFWEAKDQWYPTWNPDTNNGEDAAMKINYVRVWKTKPDP